MKVIGEIMDILFGLASLAIAVYLLIKGEVLMSIVALTAFRALTISKVEQLKQ